MIQEADAYNPNDDESSKTTTEYDEPEESEQEIVKPKKRKLKHKTEVRHWMTEPVWSC